MYVALAEAQGAPLLTCDRKLANPSGPRSELDPIETANGWT